MGTHPAGDAGLGAYAEGPGPALGLYYYGDEADAEAAADPAWDAQQRQLHAGGGRTPAHPPDKGLLNALVFGAINAIVSMPTLIAYAAIVFKVCAPTARVPASSRFACNHMHACHRPLDLQQGTCTPARVGTWAQRGGVVGRSAYPSGAA